MASQWTKDKRPSRQRYWESHTLEHTKVKHILANKQHLYNKDGVKGRLMTEPEALAFWQSKRKTRIPDKYIPLQIRYGEMLISISHPDRSFKIEII